MRAIQSGILTVLLLLLGFHPSGATQELNQSDQQYLDQGAASEKQGNYAEALAHYRKYFEVHDSLFKEDQSKEIGKLEALHEFEVAETNRKLEEEKAKIAQVAQESRRNSLQYSGILIVLVLLGAMLIALGRMRIPIRIAEGLIFFSFLLFFEFTLVMLDPYLEVFSSGEPALKLLFNAALAAMIFPLHSFFEHKLKSRIVS